MCNFCAGQICSDSCKVKAFLGVLSFYVLCMLHAALFEPLASSKKSEANLQIASYSIKNRLMKQLIAQPKHT